MFYQSFCLWSLFYLFFFYLVLFFLHLSVHPSVRLTVNLSSVYSYFSVCLSFYRSVCLYRSIQPSIKTPLFSVFFLSIHPVSRFSLFFPSVHHSGTRLCMIPRSVFLSMHFLIVQSVTVILSVCLSIHPLIYSSNLTLHLTTHPSTNPPTHSSTSINCSSHSVYPSIHPPTYSFIYLD